MTARAQFQTGKIFRDLDGSVVRLERVLNDVCVWTSDGPVGEGGATHIENFRRRFRQVRDARVR